MRKVKEKGVNRLNAIMEGNGHVEVAPPKKLLRLDLGCGQGKLPDYTGVDIWSGPNVDVVADLFKFPWPFEDESAEEAFASHFFEHVPGPLRFGFMDELWRVLIPGGKAVIVVPYYSSMRAAQDPSHMWPPIAESSFLYFNKGWRDANKLDHYPVKCDFDFSYAFSVVPEWQNRSEETQRFAIQHYLNVVSDLHVTLIKRPSEGNKG